MMKKTIKLIGLIILFIISSYIVVSMTYNIFIPRQYVMTAWDENDTVILNQTCEMGIFKSTCGFTQHHIFNISINLSNYDSDQGGEIEIPIGTFRLGERI